MMKFIYELRRKIHVKSLRKLLNNFDKSCDFNRSSLVSYQDGSNYSDITLGRNVWMYGHLFTQNHGKIIIEDFVKIGEGSLIGSVNYIKIGKETAIASNVSIIDNNNHPINPEDRRIMRHTPVGSQERMWKYSDNSPIIIGENVWIGQNVRINKGVTVGDNSIIGANSVVTHNIPRNAIAVGNPARIVKTDIDKTTESVFKTKDIN